MKERSPLQNKSLGCTNEFVTPLSATLMFNLVILFNNKHSVVRLLLDGKVVFTVNFSCLAQALCKQMLGAGVQIRSQETGC